MVRFITSNNSSSDEMFSMIDIVSNYQTLLQVYLAFYILTLTKISSRSHVLNCLTYYILINVINIGTVADQFGVYFSVQYETIALIVSYTIIMALYVFLYRLYYASSTLIFKHFFLLIPFSGFGILSTGCYYYSLNNDSTTNKKLLAINAFHVFYLALVNYFQRQETKEEEENFNKGRKVVQGLISFLKKSLECLLIVILMFIFCNVINQKLIFNDDSISTEMIIPNIDDRFVTFWLTNLFIVEGCKLLYSALKIEEEEQEQDAPEEVQQEFIDEKLILTPEDQV